EEGQNLTTGQTYSKYREVANRVGKEPITQRRAQDLIDELDMLGVYRAEVESKGKHGRTRSIHVDLSEKTVNKLKEYVENEFPSVTSQAPKQKTR
ncbi:MAG: cell division control protein Cdc6, partial [Candidatus Nanohaloarchaea archaeon]